MNRGRFSLGPVGRLSTCFNEAPIHESGKLGRAAFPRPRCPRFNEAPIHESGKSMCSGPMAPESCAASMRPRFMNRGRRARDPGPSRTPRFNEAPIHESGKPPNGSLPPKSSVMLRFNEAPIHESGKSSSRMR